jgi:hypothetical protein
MAPGLTVPENDSLMPAACPHLTMNGPGLGQNILQLFSFPGAPADLQVPSAGPRRGIFRISLAMCGKETLKSMSSFDKKSANREKSVPERSPRANLYCLQAQSDLPMIIVCELLLKSRPALAELYTKPAGRQESEHH